MNGMDLASLWFVRPNKGDDSEIWCDISLSSASTRAHNLSARHNGDDVECMWIQWWGHQLLCSWWRTKHCYLWLTTWKEQWWNCIEGCRKDACIEGTRHADISLLTAIETSQASANTALLSIHRSNNKSENNTQKARPKERQQRSSRSLAYQQTIPPVPLSASLRRRLPKRFRSFPCQSKTPLPPPPSNQNCVLAPKSKLSTYRPSANTPLTWSPSLLSRNRSHYLYRRDGKEAQACSRHSIPPGYIRLGSSLRCRGGYERQYCLGRVGRNVPCV